MNNINSAIEKHFNKFKIEPNIIGLYFENPKQVYDNILKAIEKNKPYDEYELLSIEQKKAFDMRELLF